MHKFRPTKIYTLLNKVKLQCSEHKQHSASCIFSLHLRDRERERERKESLTKKEKDRKKERMRDRERKKGKKRKNHKPPG